MEFHGMNTETYPYVSSILQTDAVEKTKSLGAARRAIDVIIGLSL